MAIPLSKFLFALSNIVMFSVNSVQLPWGQLVFTPHSNQEQQFVAPTSISKIVLKGEVGS